VVPPSVPLAGPVPEQVQSDGLFRLTNDVFKLGRATSGAVKNMTKYVFLPSLALFLFSCTLLAQEEHHHIQALENVGNVSFPITCDQSVQKKFERGVALLHSFWYEEAQKSFKEVLDQDPHCAIAYWGQAMSIYRPLWNRPTASDLQNGRKLIQVAQTFDGNSRRERDYIDALAVFYGDDNRDYQKRSADYCDVMRKLFSQYPKDREAAVFYALALLGSQPDNDAKLENSRKAIAILAKLFKEQPNHPGAAHYLIHAADNPHLADLGLSAARRYAQIAPASPHALHMPSHIFARLGLWQEDIQSNLASIAATRQSSGMHVGAEHQIHAMDFLEYAYLQIGENNKAKAVVENLADIREDAVDPGLDGYLDGMRAHLPAMYALETHQWKEALALQPPAGAEASSKAITYWARAVAAGHLRDVAAARDAVEQYDAMLDTVRKSSRPYRADFMSTNGSEARAWLVFAEGKNDEALRLLRSVADKQDAEGKGEVELPAREMLGDMLVEINRLREALAEYEKSLNTDPNRFNGLYGAARSAELLQQPRTAARYYAQLLKNCEAPSQRPELSHAKELLARN
jgi:tetratricopeptide (TPR) repeat protein